MADLPQKERPQFIEALRYQRRRNLAAAFVARASAPSGLIVNGPSLTLTALSITVAVSGLGSQEFVGRPNWVDQTQTQKRRNLAATYLATQSAPPAGPGVALSPVSLSLIALAPTIMQTTPIVGGQDLQSERDPEIWQPGRRNYQYAYQSPGSNTVIVNSIGLTLTAPSPSVSQSGTTLIASGALTLTAFPPVITQTFLGFVAFTPIALSLTALSPVISISGPGVVDVIPPGLTLADLPVTITQLTEIGRVTTRMFTYKPSLRMLPRG